MPLMKGLSQEIIGRNIAELIKAGYKPEQAASTVYNAARKSNDVDEELIPVEGGDTVGGGIETKFTTILERMRRGYQGRSRMYIK